MHRIEFATSYVNRYVLGDGSAFPARDRCAIPAAQTTGNFMAEEVEIKEEITPTRLRCTGGSCPSVYRLSDGNLLIVGKRPSAALAQQVQGKVASDEFAIVVSPELVSGQL
jgi:hypothetical protein